MDIQFKPVGQVLVVQIADKRIDAAAGPDLKAKVGARVEQGDQRLVLDLSAVEFVDSTGLGAILSLVKRMPPGGNLVLTGCRPAITDLLRLTRLDRVFRVFPSEQDAVASFAA